MTKPITLDLTPRQIKALGDRTLIALESIEACWSTDDARTPTADT